LIIAAFCQKLLMLLLSPLVVVVTVTVTFTAHCAVAHTLAVVASVTGSLMHF